MCANKYPKNDGCIFNGSRDIQQTSTLGLTDPARVPVLQSASSAGLNQINQKGQTFFIYLYFFQYIVYKVQTKLFTVYLKIFSDCDNNFVF